MRRNQKVMVDTEIAVPLFIADAKITSTVRPTDKRVTVQDTETKKIYTVPIAHVHPQWRG